MTIDWDILRIYLGIAVSMILTIMMISRLVLFASVRIPGKRVRFEFWLGYILMAVGALTGVIIEPLAHSWSSLLVSGGIAAILWRTLNEWSPSRIPPWVLVDDREGWQRDETRQ